MKYSNVVLISIMTIAGSIINAQNIEFERNVKIKSSNLEFRNGNSQFNLLYTDGDGDFVILNPIGRFWEYKQNGDLLLPAGGDLYFNSPDNSKTYTMSLENDGSFSINRTNNTAALYFDGSKNTMGVNIAIPQTALHIRQANVPTFNGVGNFVTNLPGITIQENGGTNTSTLFLDNTGHLNIAFNGLYQGWWNRANGVYTSVSDARLKKNVHTLGQVLGKVLKLRPTTYHFKTQSDSEKATLGFIAQEVESVFPLIVDQKEGLKALTYDYFGILSIKAIQEQQVIIEQQATLLKKLIERIEKLEDYQR